MPSWDNSARRQDSSTILCNSDPELFEIWTRYIRSYNYCNFKKEEQFLFINAWNEWGEGCHLEPDQKYGLKYLEAFMKSASSKYSFKSLEKIKENSLSILKKKIKQQINKKASKETEKAVMINMKAKSLLIKINLKYCKDRFAKKLYSLPLIFKLLRTFYLVLKRILKFIFSRIKNLY